MRRSARGSSMLRVDEGEGAARRKRRAARDVRLKGPLHQRPGDLGIVTGEAGRLQEHAAFVVAGLVETQLEGTDDALPCRLDLSSPSGETIFVPAVRSVSSSEGFM